MRNFRTFFCRLVPSCVRARLCAHGVTCPNGHRWCLRSPARRRCTRSPSPRPQPPRRPNPTRRAPGAPGAPRTEGGAAPTHPSWRLRPALNACTTQWARLHTVVGKHQTSCGGAGLRQAGSTGGAHLSEGHAARTPTGAESISFWTLFGHLRVIHPQPSTIPPAQRAEDGTRTHNLREPFSRVT